MGGQEGPGHLGTTGLQGQKLAKPSWVVPLCRQGGDRREAGHRGSLASRSRLWGLEKHTGLFLGSCWLCFLSSS